MQARRVFADPTGGYLVFGSAFGSASKGGLDRGALVFVDDLGAVDTSKGTDGFTFYDWTPNHCYVLDVVEEPGTGMFFLAGSAWDATGDPDSAVMRMGAAHCVGRPASGAPLSAPTSARRGPGPRWPRAAG